jgi:hypothetical protein
LLLIARPGRHLSRLRLHPLSLPVLTSVDVQQTRKAHHQPGSDHRNPTVS